MVISTPSFGPTPLITFAKWGIILPYYIQVLSKNTSLVFWSFSEVEVVFSKTLINLVSNFVDFDAGSLGIWSCIYDY